MGKDSLVDAVIGVEHPARIGFTTYVRPLFISLATNNHFCSLLSMGGLQWGYCLNG
ncbi:hypothetical protein Pcaca05_26940 [Pectobacterium carotovorum subsp. carotovorum]|nr:hypothetical protein Pcaca05_26940 [Pectobacterium carotovorum subsp. carotovorum]